jgi:type VI secretion system protein
MTLGMWRGIRFWGIAAGALIAFAAASCSAVSSARSMFGGTAPFHVTVAPDANENSAVAVDLVVVYDRKLVDELTKLPAAKWFAGKEQFAKDHPGQVLIRSWEWVPGQRVGDVAVQYESGAKKIMLFANYLTEGDHRKVLDPQHPFELALDALDFTAEPKP